MLEQPQYCILMVDDEKKLLEYMEKIFSVKRPNWQVLTACDGQEALDRLQEKDNQCDAIIIDLKMPGMSGEQLLEKIVERNLDICPIILTAYGDVQKATSAVKLGAYDFLSKPLDSDKLIAIIEEGVSAKKMAALMQEILMILNPDEVFDKVIQIAELRFRPSGYCLAIIEKDQGQMMIKRAFDTIRRSHIIDRPLNGQKPKFVETVLNSEQSLRLGDVDPKEWGTFLANARSLLAIPMKLPPGEIRGLLSIESLEPDAFDVKAQLFLTMLAANASIALHNAEVAEAIRKGREEQQKIKGLTARVAHEIRNTLQPALTAQGFLDTWPHTDKDEFMRHLKTIHDCLLEVNNQMADLIDLTRVNRFEPEPLHLSQTIEEAVQALKDFAAQSNLEIITLPVADLPAIAGDRIRLKRVFGNLIRNAADAVVAKGKAGQLTITTELTEDQQQVIISFTDNGIGIESQHLSKIFDPFFTTKTGRRAFGLGLALAKEV
ncbi:MAG: response regulator, partial [candidate division KSB1 bacterium]|nr:response regulator [candidate division KSB1 bacterium]